VEISHVAVGAIAFDLLLGVRAAVLVAVRGGRTGIGGQDAQTESQTEDYESESLHDLSFQVRRPAAAV
jgi:hypothetical protein